MKDKHTQRNQAQVPRSEGTPGARLFARVDAPARRALAAALCLPGEQLLLFSAEKERGWSSGLIWLLLFGLNCAAFSSLHSHRPDRRVSRMGTLLGCVFALAVFLGWQLSRYDCLLLFYPDRLKTYQAVWLCFQLLGLAWLFSAILSLGLQLLLQSEERFRSKVEDGGTGRRRWLRWLLLLLLCWLPYYLVYFPGLLTPDSQSEILQQLGVLSLSNHHPVIHQWMLRPWILLGERLGSLGLGVGLFCALQMLLMAACFAGGLRFAERAGAGALLRKALFCFFAFYPVHGFYSITVWKDISFAGVTLLLSLLLIRLARETPGHRPDFGIGAAFVLLGFLFCTLRNNGYYAYLLAAPFFLLVNRRRFRRLLPLLLLPPLLVIGYQHLLFDGLQVEKGRSAEALSIPLQQMVRTLRDHGEELDEEQLQTLQELFPSTEYVVEHYQSQTSDAIKSPAAFRSERFDREPLRYLRCWAELGRRYPLTYAESFLLGNYGYWYPDVVHWIIPTSREAAEGINDLAPPAGSLRERLQDEGFFLFSLVSNQWPSQALFHIGLTSWLLAAAAALLALKRQWGVLSASFPLWGIWATTLASPVFCEYRYLYSLVVTVPLFLVLALCLEARE